MSTFESLFLIPLSQLLFSAEADIKIHLTFGILESQSIEDEEEKEARDGSSDIWINQTHYA